VTATRRHLDVSHGRLAWAGEHPPRVLAVAGYLATVVAVNWTTARFGLLPVWPGVLAPAGVFAAVTGQSGVAFYGRVANDGQAEVQTPTGGGCDGGVARRVAGGRLLQRCVGTSSRRHDRPSARRAAPCARKRHGLAHLPAEAGTPRPPLRRAYPSPPRPDRAARRRPPPRPRRVVGVHRGRPAYPRRHPVPAHTTPPWSAW